MNSIAAQIANNVGFNGTVHCKKMLSKFQENLYVKELHYEFSGIYSSCLKIQVRFYIMCIVYDHKNSAKCCCSILKIENMYENKHPFWVTAGK